MRRLFLGTALAVFAGPALAVEFAMPPSGSATPSHVLPFSAKDSFGHPTGAVRDVFPGDAPPQNVEFAIRGDGASTGPLPGLSITATRSLYPTSDPFFKGTQP